MEKRVAAFEARRQFGRILEEVVARNNAFVVERHGEPVAAVVPLRVYESWKRRRSELVELIEKASRHSALSLEEAEALAEEAVRAVRAANS